MKLWRVAVSGPFLDGLTYSSKCKYQLDTSGTADVPSETRTKPIELAPGMWVQVPLGKRKALGLLLAEEDQPKPDIEFKEILGVDEAYPKLPMPTLRWISWLAQYYVYPTGFLMNSLCPPLERSKKPRKIISNDLRPDPERKTLNGEQLLAVQNIQLKKNFSVHLVYGVTGSGKTEVYLELIAKTLSEGKKALFLLPEISLTPQLVQRVEKRFPGLVATLHSQLTERIRTDEWWSIVSGEKQILVGARSALFCPIANLGLVVVDEEHEPSYKQDERLRYHGRDAAIVLGKHWDIPVVLGTATPSAETWQNVVQKKYGLSVLTRKALSSQEARVEIVDLRSRDPKETGNPVWLSAELLDALADRLRKGEQSALFLNRRGLAPVVFCRLCGFKIECPNCDISMTLHSQNHMFCHYCGFSAVVPQQCPSCHEDGLVPLGFGTKTVEGELSRLFPEARIARADSDEIANRHELTDLIERMENREIDILVGTQMIAKGLDFKDLTLACILMADVTFGLPDFRASERSAQLVRQMAGRAGRHEMQGRSEALILIQTFNPDHPSLRLDLPYVEFLEKEIELRKTLDYPPSGKLALIRLSNANRKVLFEESEKVRRALAAFVEKEAREVQILGPADPPVAKLRNQFRQVILLKVSMASAKTVSLSSIGRRLAGLKLKSRLIVDIDPVSIN